MRKKTWGGGRRFEPSPPAPGMWKEEDMIMAMVQLEYEVRFDCRPWNFSSAIKNLTKHTAVLEIPSCPRYGSDMKSRTIQSGLRLEDEFLFFPKLCFSGLTWSHERTSLDVFTATTSISGWVVGFRTRIYIYIYIQNKNGVEWKRGIPLNV